MNAQVFRDPKSSNRIEISRFIKFLLTFDWFQGFTPWGVGGWDSVRVFGGVPHACAHMHMHAHMHAYMNKHDNFMQMAAPIGKSWGIPLWHYHSCVHACACMHVHTCMGHPPPNTLTESHPPPWGADPQNQSKVNKNLTNRDISILFEDFKFVEISPPTHTHTHTQFNFVWRHFKSLKSNKSWPNWDNSIMDILDFF